MFTTTYHLTLWRFDEGKKNRIVCNKMVQKSNAKCSGDVAATLRQRLDNVGERCFHNVRKQRWHNSHFWPCHNVLITSTTTLRQRCHNVAVPAGLVLQWEFDNLLSGFLNYRTYLIIHCEFITVNLPDTHQIVFKMLKIR